LLALVLTLACLVPQVSLRARSSPDCSHWIPAHTGCHFVGAEPQGNKELSAAAFNARVIPSEAYTDPEVA